ncbi:hypothetical protein BUE80_DR009502 [Diplocarpon rosae]|nr:hypothetical protein BUE80_DR009502 [Diplocarpon rosae]
MSTPPHSCLHATPPESFTNPPLADKKGLTLVSRIIELQHELERDESLWGYDYFPSASQLVIRRPTLLHQAVTKRIVKEIEVQLKSIQDRFIKDSSAEFANEISSERSSTIKSTDEEYSRHDPDEQFRHQKAQFPGVVIEVSYSQKRKDLGRLADDYILGSDGEVRVVAGVHIGCRNSKKATLSVWRPKIVTNQAGEKEVVAQLVVANQVSIRSFNFTSHADPLQVFRDTNGNQAYLVQKAFDYAFETSPRKPWPRIAYAIRLSSLQTSYVRFFKTRGMQRLSLRCRLASPQQTSRG